MKEDIIKKMNMVEMQTKKDKNNNRVCGKDSRIVILQG